MLKKIDIYIIKKFLGTFFFSILLIISIAIVFDVSEHIDDFIEKDAPLDAILFEHYLTFIPYFVNLFSYLFVFISVIFFTSKMAANSEIIAILSSGVSFRRFLWPYFLSALFLAVFSFFLTTYIIPPANEVRLNFENTYIRNKFRNFDKNIHKQIEPGIFVYLDNYNVDFDIGNRFTIEKINNNKLISKTMADFVKWDSIEKTWELNNYVTRDILEDKTEVITKGIVLDTVIKMEPEDFKRRETIVETMNLTELNKFIDQQKLQGSENVIAYEVYRYKLFSYPFSTFILTLIGVSLAIRKVRGGLGIHIGFGLALSFGYIVFMQFSTNFAIGGNMNPILAVWLPNILFTIIGFFLYRFAPK
ncbi:MAG: LptF/LptG family permease [Bacteroidota bacterium]